MEIKRASNNDIEAISQLLLESGISAVNRVTDSLQHVYLAFTKNNELAGVGAMEKIGSVALLHTLVVRESLRGQGFGYLLMKTLDHAARSEDIDEIYVVSDSLTDYFKRYGYDSVSAGALSSELSASALFQQCAQASADKNSVMRLSVAVNA